MRIYKDTVKSFLITLGAIALLGLVGFVLGSWLLRPKAVQEPARQVYQPKVSYPNGPITLTYWRTVDGAAVFEPILKKWSQYHPNVTIQITDIAYADYDKKLTEAANSGKLPDMFMLRSDWVPRYKARLSGAPKEVFSKDEYKSTFAEVVSSNLIVGDDIKAVAYGVPTLGLFYNIDLYQQAGLEKAPTNWQQLLGANSKLVKKSGNGLLGSGIALGTAQVSNASSIMPLLMMQNGAVMTNTPPTEATFQKPSPDNYPSSPKALDFYTSFAKPGKSSYSWSDGFGDSTQAFIGGKTAMMIDYPYRYLSIKAQVPNLNFKMAKVPQVNESSPLNYTEYWAEGVSTSSKYPEIAWDFYNFMTSYDIMNMYSVPTMKPASRLDLAKAQEQDTVIGPFAAQVPTARSYYKGSNYQSDAAILEMINSSLAGFDSAIAVRVASDKVSASIKQFPY